MKTRWTAIAVLSAALIGWVAGVGFTDEKEPTEEEMMAKMMALAAPGPQHANLKAFAGIWDVKSTFYMKAGPLEGEATSTLDLVFGGRFLVMNYEGDFGGMPFLGKAAIGYDNLTKKYQYIWLDNFSSSMMLNEGTCSEDGKTITMTGTHPSPWGPVQVRWVMTSESLEKFTFTMYSKKGDAEEKKEGHLVFTKPKALNQMEMWPKIMEMAAPGAEHGDMKPLVGEFSFKGTLFTGMGEMPFEGSVDNTMILGGRFMRTEYASSVMGTPMEGYGLMGYDNIKQTYQQTWCMNMNSGIDWSTGSYDPATKTFTLTHEVLLPDRTVQVKRATTVIESAEKHVLTQYTRLKGSNDESKEMEMVYTRKKAE